MRLTISTRNARFQQWEALLTNRAKRHRSGEFLVQGVRPVTLAIENGWPIHALIHRHGAALSQWALKLVNTLDTLHVTMAGELLDELAEKSAEIVAVVGRKPDELARIDPSGLTVVFDRPSSPGNVGTLIRSADAFGAGGVIVTGHAADIYDPKAVRASTGSLFCVPVVRLEAYPQEWLDRSGAQVVGLDESGSVELRDVDLTGPTILVVGNETNGMSAAWREACHVMAYIPIGGGASSLNAAAAGSVALYEASRQRRV
ncbi:TrmH family RNA methyltransferase [Catelliglobosispora koreensis]|uniref:TrmH family RNA methyltransferase n=1 Tax=Catelliglobosispora koreensis TaxID=129052 RepID=UPI000381F65D|nr:TrmH family RNA methyltransferase [Catelliglobosispora koreensis]